MVNLFLTFEEWEKAGHLNQECCPRWNKILSVQNNHLNFIKQKRSSAGAMNLLDCLKKYEHTLEAHFEKPKIKKNYSQCFLNTIGVPVYLFGKEGILIQDIQNIVQILMTILISQKILIAVSKTVAITILSLMTILRTPKTQATYLTLRS